MYDNHLKKRYFLFCCLLLSLIGIFWLVALITRGATINMYFVPDSTDTSMDYFNMLANIPGLDPYAQNANYPALPFLIWRIFYRMIPSYPQGNDGHFLRGTMEAQLGYILCLIICFILLWELVKHTVKLDKFYPALLAISLVLSGPILFTIERGNIIFLSFLFSFLFILMFDASQKGIRYCAYFCLAIAAAIKIYPAVLGLLVVVKKRYKEAVALMVLGILCFIIPFFVFDGLESLKTMLYGISLSSAESIQQGFGCNFSFGNLVRLFYACMGVYKEQITSFTYIMPIIICISVFLLSKELWKKVFSLILFMVWMPAFSYTYTLIFFILPLVIFLAQNKNKFDYLYTILFAFILAPWAFPKVDFINNVADFDFKFFTSYGMLIINFSIFIFSLLLIIDGIIHIYERKRNDYKYTKKYCTAKKI